MSVVDAATEVAPIRRFYAEEEIGILGGVESPAIIEAFATVPRERFLGPGPWNLCLSDTGQCSDTARRRTITRGTSITTCRLRSTRRGC